MTKRVYHPTLNAWQDVDDAAVKDWREAGWRTSRPEHVDDSDAPAVGEHPGFAHVAVTADEARSDATEPAPAKPAPVEDAPAS